MNLRYCLLILPLFLGACGHFQKPAAFPSSKPIVAIAEFPNRADLQKNITKSVKWREYFINPNLVNAIDFGLKNNADLKITVFNIQKAQNALELAKIAQKPSLRAIASSDLTGKSGDLLSDAYSVGANAPSYEIDIFGRLKSLEKASEENFYAARENQKAIKIAYITTIANAWVNISTDMAQIQVFNANINSLSETAKIIHGRRKYGIASDLDTNSIDAQLNELRAALKATQTKLENDKSTLTFLAGGQGVLQFLPNGKDDFKIANIPDGLPSNVLLARPDIMAAEHSLAAADANIMAARAQKFPTISLTASLGFASSELLNLLGGPRFALTPSISAPIFDNGANDIAISNVKLNRDILVQQYEKAIYSAFNEVSQTLNIRALIEGRLQDENAAVKNYQQSVFLAKRRFQVGIDNYLPLLVAERNLNNAQATLLGLQSIRATNLISLYSALSNDDLF